MFFDIQEMALPARDRMKLRDDGAALKMTATALGSVKDVLSRLAPDMSAASRKQLDAISLAL